MPTLVFKYIIIGDSAVGKSSLLLQFTEKQWRPVHEMTIGVEFGQRSVTVNDSPVNLEIWDTAGQEAYLSITRSYYRNADGCLLVFDITRRKTFESLQRWIDLAKMHCENPSLVFILIGNKADLQQERQVTQSEAQSFAKKNDMTYIELTAKNFPAVEEVFTKTAQSIYQAYESDSPQEKLLTIDAHGRIRLGSTSSTRTSSASESSLPTSLRSGKECCQG